MKNIICFGGSNSSASINQKLVGYIANENKDLAAFEVVNLNDYRAPLFGVDEMKENGIPDSMKTLMEKFKAADAIMVSVAEHNGSITAALKSTFDWLSMIEQKFFLNKPTVFLSTSPGPRGAASALKHMVEIMPYRGADIKGSYSLGSFSEKFENQDFKETKEYQEILDILKEGIL